MIWVIGCKGMLGQEITHCFEKSEIAFTGSDIEISVLDKDALASYTAKIMPSWIINCSAYIDVDKAEDEEEMAYAINRDGIANIAQVAKELDIPVVHISTDYVFDGTSLNPLGEDDPVAPKSVYGSSKLAGEEAVRTITSKHFIIRTAWLYGKHGNNFVFTMLKLMKSKDEIKVVDDQFGSPTWACDLTVLIKTIIESSSSAYGTYNFSGEGNCTWYGFASKIYNLGKENGIIESACNILPCLSKDFPTKAKRPKYSLLSKEKVKKTFKIEIADWDVSLSHFICEVKNEKDIKNEKA